MKLKCEIVSGRRKTMDEVQVTESLFVHFQDEWAKSMAVANNVQH